MKKALAILVCLPLLVLSSDARSKNQMVLVQHAQANQESLHASDKDRESKFSVSEAGIAFAISAGMIAGDGGTASLVLKVTNATGKARVFAPSEIVVILPNGHSYRPLAKSMCWRRLTRSKATPRGGGQLSILRRHRRASAPVAP